MFTADPASLDNTARERAEPTHAAPSQQGDWTFTAVYSLGFLTLITAFNYLDRSLLGLALPQIKAEMGLSDTVMGLVSGLAFVLFYSLMGVPIAWAADRYSRRNIIAAGFAFWSLATLVNGWISNVWQLATARFLMGAGEACAIAPSNSMTADLFRPERRTLAYSIFTSATSISSILFFPIAGWVGQHYGWRQMFIVAGIPGIVLALIFRLTVPEPRRGASEARGAERGAKAVREDKPPFAASVARLFRTRGYVALLVAATMMGMNVFAASVWTPTFLVRVHGLTLTEVATTVGPIRGFCGLAGVLIGGWVIDRLGRRNPRWRMTIAAAACFLVAPAEAIYAIADSHSVWLGAYAASGFLLLIHQGPVFAGVVAVSDVRSRALATSILLFCSAMFGQAIGPLLVGMSNDLLEPRFGAEAIRYSMLIIALTAAIAGLSLLQAGHSIQRTGDGTAE